MPELPEVETVVRDLSEAGLLGREIQAITVRWPRILARPSTLGGAYPSLGGTD